MDTHAEDIEGPPLNPAAETVVADNGAFVEKCRSAIEEFASRLDIQLHRGVLTENETWGLVWRVDFTFPDKDFSPRVNRIVCWQNSDGKIVVQIAVGQLLPPLPFPS